MWTWDYELRTLGSWPSERYNGHNMPVEVVTKADHDAALRRAKAEGVALASEILGERIKQLTSRSGCEDDKRWPEMAIRREACIEELKQRSAVLSARAAQIEEGEHGQT